MDYREAIDYIHGTLRFGSKLGLENIKYLLELMDNPQDKLKFVHVGGTNGKGSTVSFISTILMESGYRVGIFTSPYIERFTERIKVNEEEIQEKELAYITEFVKSKVEIMVEEGKNHPTEFEIVTAIAFQYYLQKKCDIVVLEVGLGGRFDSTNVIKPPLVSVITSISYDHMEFLGDTLEKIAFEKAGIIKESSSVVLYPQEESVTKVFEEACKNNNAALHKVNIEDIKIKSCEIMNQTFDYMEFQNMQISLVGKHQVNNAVVALKTIKVLKSKGFNLPDEQIKTGLLNTKWAGRLEIILEEPYFLIDGAHNIGGAESLAQAIKENFPCKRKIFILGVLRDKDYKTILKTIAPLADIIITLTPFSNRALSSEELAIEASKYCDNVIIGDTVDDAVNLSLEISNSDDLICAFGSLYIIGHIRTKLKLIKEKKNCKKVLV